VALASGSRIGAYEIVSLLGAETLPEAFTQFARQRAAMAGRRQRLLWRIVTMALKKYVRK